MCTMPLQSAPLLSSLTKTPAQRRFNLQDEIPLQGKPRKVKAGDQKALGSQGGVIHSHKTALSEIKVLHQALLNGGFQGQLAEAGHPEISI